MTDSPQYFTVSPDRDAHEWRSVEIHDGRKMSGRAYVHTSWKPAEHPHLRDRHVITVDLGRHLNDENGRTVYREADPSADEVNTGVTGSANSAVIARPVRVNGIAYSGTLYLEREHDGNGNPVGRWRVRDGYINRADDYFGKVTDAARSRLHDLAKDLAGEIVTDETVGWDTVRAARREIDDAERKVREAKAELETARKTAREAINAYEAMAET